jgi:hypothetical protein
LRELQLLNEKVEERKKLPKEYIEDERKLRLYLNRIKYARNDNKQVFFRQLSIGANIKSDIMRQTFCLIRHPDLIATLFEKIEEAVPSERKYPKLKNVVAFSFKSFKKYMDEYGLLAKKGAKAPDRQLKFLSD